MGMFSRTKAVKKGEGDGSDGLVYAYMAAPGAKPRAVGWAELRHWKPGGGLLWVHLNRAHPQAQSWLRKGAGLEPLVAEALVAAETRPRSLVTEQGLLASLRGINFNPGADPEDMIAMRVFLQGERLITTRTRKLMAGDDLRRRFEDGTAPASAGGCFVALAQSLIGRVGGVLEDLDDTADAMEEGLLGVKGAATPLRDRLTALRQRAIALRRYLAPQREALSAIVADGTRHNLFAADEIAQLRELTDQNTRYVEDLDSMRERAGIIQDELLNRLSDRLNRNSYALTIIAALFLPLTAITGLLGVNIGGMNEGAAGTGFVTLCWVLGGVVLFELALFKLLKWI